MRLTPFIFLFLMACTNNSFTPPALQDSMKKDGTVVADTATKPTDTLPLITAPQGIYTATIRCKGCKSVEQTVAFLPRRTFQMEEKKDGEKRIQKTRGTWMASKGTIWLYEDAVVKARYVWQGDTLIYLHPNGQKTIMEKRVAATDNDVWRKKGAEGLEFFGVGNEPFWSIEIDEEKAIRFQLADWDKPVQFKPVQPSIAPDSMVYYSGVDSAALKVIVYAAFCSDGMSDHIYTSRVSVLYKGNLYKGCGLSFRH